MAGCADPGAYPAVLYSARPTAGRRVIGAGLAMDAIPAGAGESMTPAGMGAGAHPGVLGGVPDPAPRTLGLAIAVGSAVAIACASAVGLLGGVTNTQFAYGAILLGVFTGQAVRRVRRDTPAAVAAGLISLAGSALASLIAVTMRLVEAVHIPLSTVLAHMPVVVSILPHIIGWFGFLCWALSAFTGWGSVGRQRIRTAPVSGQTAPPSQDQAAGSGQQPDGPPGAQPGHSGSGFAAPPGQAPGLGPTQMPGS
jgi:hypothetical protein